MATAAPATTRTITATDLYALRFADDVVLSPDGTKVAFTVTQPDGEVNRNRASIWVANTDGSGARQVTSGVKKDTAPVWSPDGTKIAFVSDRGGKGQIFVLDLAGGGEARQLTTDEESAASDPVWSPDGARIAYLCKVPSLPEPQHNVEYKDDADKPKIITRAKYKFDGEGFFDHRRKQLFAIPAHGGEARQLTEGTMGVGAPQWSPDGSKIAFVSNREEDHDHDRRMDVWTVDVASGQMARITPHDGGYGSPAWSPDGQSIALVGHAYPSKGGTNNRLYVAPAGGGGEMRQVTEFDRSIGSGVMSDTGTDGRGRPAWVGDDLYFLAAMDGTAQVFRAPAAGGEATQVTFGNHAIAGWDITADGTMLAYSASTQTNPGEVFAQPLGAPGEPVAKLTDLNSGAVGEIELGKVEEFWFDAPDGTGEQIQGWIMKPPGFDASRKYPTILEIHGGPASTYGVGWFHEFQFFAAQGYVIVYCNPRGSQGYGEAFATAIYQDWGTKPFMDVMAALDHAIAQGYVDTDHLYVTGGSYGGYMTNWVVTHTDRFRAAATQRCVSNVMTLALVDDISIPFTSDNFGGAPWEVPEVYTRNSPITYIANCTTPTLIEHEEEDHRCPMDQAEQMYNALQRLGVETELIRYPKESHGMSRDGGPLHRVDRLQRIIGWFERHK